MKKLIKSMALCAAASVILLTGCKPQAGGDSSMYDTFIPISKTTSLLDKDISVSKYEVSRAWYKHYMGDLDVSAEYPMTASEGDARPADGITKPAAAKFCNLLSNKYGYTPFYTIEGDTVTESTADGHEYGFRLLTRTEWETCAKAGTTNLFAGTSGSYADKVKSGNIAYTIQIKEDADGGDGSLTSVNGENSYQNVGDEELSKYAWNKYNVRTGEVENPIQSRKAWNEGDWTVYTADNGLVYKQNKWGFAAARGGMDDSQYGTHAVGTRKANEWGFCDMTGNVSELVEDGAFIGGDVASNPSQIYIGHSSYNAKIKGLRICRTIESTGGEK